MAILTIAKYALKGFGIIPIENRRPSLNLLHTIVAASCFLLYLSSLGHFLIFKAKSSVAFFLVVFFFSLSVMRVTLYFLILLERPKLMVFMEDLEVVVERRCTRPEIREIYAQEMKDAETFAKKAFKWMAVSATLIPFMKVFESYLRYYWMHNGAQSFKPVMPGTLPVNSKTPGGYFLAIAIQSVWLVGGAGLVMTIVLTSCGICSIFVAASKDIDKYWSELNDIVIAANQNYTVENRIEITKRFIAIVKFHAEIRGLITRFSKTYSLILTALFAMSTPCIAISLLNVNTAVGLGHKLDVVRLFIIFVFMLIYIIVLCLNGNSVTHRFEEINGTMWNCTWNEFPHEIQKMLPLVLAVTQEPFYIEGFMNVQCTREVLKKIINGSYSYFSILRGLSN